MDDNNIDNIEININSITDLVGNLKTEANGRYVDDFNDFISSYTGDMDLLFKFTTTFIELLLDLEELSTKAQGYDKLVAIKKKYRPQIEEIENKIELLEGQLNRTTPVTEYSEED